MSKQSIFITGGTGFFGKSILDHLLTRGSLPGLDPDCALTLLSRNPQAFLDANPRFRQLRALSFLQGDVRSFAFPKASFDLIIHAATEASVRLEQEQPDEMYSVCVEGTRRLLDFARRCGCRRFLLTSSGAVYGPQPPDVDAMPETHPCAPLLAYGKGKLAAEQEAAECGTREGFETLIARGFAFVGPHLPLDRHFAIGNFIRDCLAGQPIVIHGDGTPLRAYLDAEDLVTWLFRILLQGAHARPYNVGSERAISIAELARLVRACAGTANEVLIRQEPKPGEQPQRYVPSVQRARQELGLEQTVELQEALRRTLRYHQQKDTP